MREKSSFTALLLATLLCTGCGYGEVSPEAYEYAKALYSITNRQAEDNLDEVTTQISQAVGQGELSAAEGKMLQAIVGKAADGDWKAAQRDARALMEAQVKPK